MQIIRAVLEYRRQLVSCRGFSLVEIIIVVVILGIAAMIAVPMMSSAGSVQVNSAANMLAADLEYAKGMAIGRQRNYGVVFDVVNETYEIVDESGTVVGHPVKIGFNYSVDFKNDSRLGRVEIDAADFNGTTKIEFDYLGSPYDENGNGLSSSGTVTLQAGDFSKTVSVEPVTGYISIN